MELALAHGRHDGLDALADRSGVSRSMISLVERGESSPTAVVIEKLAAGLGVLEHEYAQLLTVAIGVSMAVTAAGWTLANVLLLSRLQAPPSVLGKLDKEGGEMAGHVVVAGFGQVGKAVARHLHAQHVPIIVLDLHPKQVVASRTRRLPVFYGNIFKTGEIEPGKSIR